MQNQVLNFARVEVENKIKNDRSEEQAITIKHDP